MIYSTDIAREQYNRIATLDVDDPMPDNDMLTLQVVLYRWQMNCFGGAKDWQMALGMIEEAGELDEADTPELRYDAVGDVLVFGCQLLTLHRFGLNVAIQDAEHHDAVPPLIQAMGRLAKTVLKGNQKIRGLADKEAYRAASYRATVDVFAAVRDSRYVALGPIITAVANEVVLKRGKGHKAIPSA